MSVVELIQAWTVPLTGPLADTGLYGVPLDWAKSSVTGQDSALQGFGECDVGSIMSAEIVAEV